MSLTDAEVQAEVEGMIEEREEELEKKHLIYKAGSIAALYSEEESRKIIGDSGPYTRHYLDGENFRKGFEDFKIRLNLENSLPEEIKVKYNDKEVLKAHAPNEVVDVSKPTPLPERERPDWNQLFVEENPPEEVTGLYFPELNFIVDTYQPGSWVEEIENLYERATKEITERKKNSLKEDFGIEF